MSKVVVFGSLNMDLSIESDHMPVMGEPSWGVASSRILVARGLTRRLPRQSSVLKW